MPPLLNRPYAAIVAAVALSAAAIGAASIKVDVEFDKTANFGAFKTYEWLESPPYVMSVAPEYADPRFEKEALDVPIKTAVDAELGRRGLRVLPTNGSADLQVVYYALMTAGANASVLGSYYQYTNGWAPRIYTDAGLPTSSLTMEEKGTLIVDIVRRADKVGVWRGRATATVDRENDQPTRLSNVREAIKKMFAKYPKQKS